MPTSFKGPTSKTFKDYQAAQIGTQKRHSLDHICEPSWKAGTLFTNILGFSRAVISISRKENSISLKGTGIVMEELFTKEARWKMSGEPLKSRRETFQNWNLSRARAVENDGAFLVNAGQFPTLVAIENV